MPKVFENKGYQNNRENICVVCGCTDSQELCKHHIIPECFIRYLNDKIRIELKARNKYYYDWDFCCVCKKCHRKYEKDYGEVFFFVLLEKYNVDINRTSYRKSKVVRLTEKLLKPSETLMLQIRTVEDYLNLRRQCTEYFKNTMKPKYELI